MDSKEIMSAAIPGTDLDIVVRRIREIGQRMYEEGEITNAPRRHRPVSRWELSGRAPHIRRRLDIGGSPYPYAPRSPSSSLPPAAIAGLPFAFGAAMSPAPASPALSSRVPLARTDSLRSRRTRCWPYRWHEWSHHPPSPGRPWRPAGQHHPDHRHP